MPVTAAAVLRCLAIDHAAGDARPRVAGRLALEVIGVAVHDDGPSDDAQGPGASVNLEDGTTSVVLALPLASAVDVAQVAGVMRRAFVRTMLLARQARNAALRWLHPARCNRLFREHEVRAPSRAEGR